MHSLVTWEAGNTHKKLKIESHELVIIAKGNVPQQIRQNHSGRLILHHDKIIQSSAMKKITFKIY